MKQFKHQAHIFGEETASFSGNTNLLQWNPVFPYVWLQTKFKIIKPHPKKKYYIVLYLVFLLKRNQPRHFQTSWAWTEHTIIRQGFLQYQEIALNEPRIPSNLVSYWEIAGFNTNLAVGNNAAFSQTSLCPRVWPRSGPGEWPGNAHS